MYDTLFPPGAPFFYAILRHLDPSMRLIDYSLWFLSSLVPLLLAYTAERLCGRTSALFVLAFSSLYFPLWEYFGYLLSEGPFLFTLLSAFLLLVLSLQAPSRRKAIFWGLAAGVMLGASAACKSCSLVSALLVFSVLIFSARKNHFRIWPSLIAAGMGLILLLIPVSIHATRLNEGRFLLIANDAPRTFLLGHQGRVGLTWFYDTARDFRMNFINPSSNQHYYAVEKTYPFGPYDAANYAAGWKWTKANPGEALLLSIEHVFDSFALVTPWPGYFRPYQPWTVFFSEVFLVLLLAPVLVHLCRSAREFGRADPSILGDMMLTAAILSIYILAFFFVGEARYRVQYDGFMIILASRAFFPRSSESSYRWCH